MSQSEELITTYLKSVGPKKDAITLKFKRNCWNRILPFLSGKELNLETAAAYLEYLQEKGRTASTIATYFKEIRAFVNWQVKNGFEKENWVRRIELPPVDTKPSFPQLAPDLIDKIIDAGTTPAPFVFGKGGDNPRSRHIKEETRFGLRFISRTALRSHEALSIEGKDLNFDSEPMEFWSLHKGSHGRKTALPIPLDMIEELRARKDKERVFEYTNETCNDALRRGVKKLGLQLRKKLTVHSLRHLWATNAQRNGTPLTTVQKQLRHKNFITTANMYIETDISDLSKAVNSMPNVKNGLTKIERLDRFDKMSREYWGSDSRFKLVVEEKDPEKGMLIRVQAI